MRKKLFALNTITSIIYQIVVLICGFILPRVILLQCGSEINGLVNSITQFLFVIQYLELGVGAATASALYKPLACNDNNKVNEIVSSATKFFDKIGAVLIGYVIILMIFYPKFNNSPFDFFYTTLLILILSINYFSQYYFGVVDNILIGANQRAYVQYSVQIITQILNTIVCVCLLKLGFGIHVVKLSTALIFLVRPLTVRLYVRKKYNLNRHVKYNIEPIEQKWNAVAQHISECILDSTDVIILTICSTLSNVSIYSVYNSVAFGMKQFFMAATNGTLSLIGEIYAKGDREELKQIYRWNEWATHSFVTIAFGCTACLITPFILVYTSQVTDTNYFQPLFGILLSLAHASHCLRLPYFTLIKAAGHYKQTQWNFIISSIINILVSVVLVSKFGLIGVTFGTMIAMLYQTTWMAHYCSKELIGVSYFDFIKQFVVDAFIVTIILLTARFIVDIRATAIIWIFDAIKMLFFAILVSALVNIIFYRQYIKQLLKKIKSKVTVKSRGE